MEEKKLTDEEIINALDKTKQELANISPEDDDYDKLLTVKTIVEYCHDLIHRLKNENDSIKKDYIELDLECRELRTEVDTKQCIITLLAKDFDDRDKQLKSKVEEVYADFMKDYKIMREELNGVYDELGEEIFAHEEFTKKANEEIERIREVNAGLALANLFDLPPNKDCLTDNEFEVARKTIAKQKAEIERLTEESDEMFDRHAKENQAASILIEKRNNEIAELQKRVDELTAFKNEAISMSLYGKGRKDGEAVAVKDTAKEILQMFDNRNYITENELKKAIAKRYGVEVE